MKKTNNNNFQWFMRILLSFNINNIFKEKTNNIYLQFFRYIFVGGIAAIVNIGALYILTEYCNIYYIISNIISFILGLITNYILSKKFVFQEETKLVPIKEFIIYAIIGVLGLIFDTTIMWFLTSLLNLYYMLSKIVSTAIVFGWNFLARKALYKMVK